jgi:AcrR family transcriptional regulator
VHRATLLNGRLPQAILREALALLEGGGTRGVSMCAIAQRFFADPMSLCHYFSDEDALLLAAATMAYAHLEPRVSRSGSVRQ